MTDPSLQPLSPKLIVFPLQSPWETLSLSPVTLGILGSSNTDCSSIKGQVQLLFCEKVWRRQWKDGLQGNISNYPSISGIWAPSAVITDRLSLTWSRQGSAGTAHQPSRPNRCFRPPPSSEDMKQKPLATGVEFVVNLPSFHMSCVLELDHQKKPQDLKFHCKRKDAGWPWGRLWEIE